MTLRESGEWPDKYPIRIPASLVPQIREPNEVVTIPITYPDGKKRSLRLTRIMFAATSEAEAGGKDTSSGLKIEPLDILDFRDDPGVSVSLPLAERATIIISAEKLILKGHQAPTYREAQGGIQSCSLRLTNITLEKDSYEIVYGVNYPNEESYSKAIMQAAKVLVKQEGRQ